MRPVSRQDQANNSEQIVGSSRSSKAYDRATSPPVAKLRKSAHFSLPCLPGRLPALQQRFETATLAIWERLGIRSLGFWTTMIGSSSNDLTYLLEWRSLAEREQKWAEFVADREWQEARAKSEADGPIIANIASSLLQPTSFYRGFPEPSE